MTSHANVFKFCSRCGSSEFLPLGVKSYKCAKCSFHFYVNSAAAVAALIFNSRGDVLLTTRGIEPHKGTLDLPGGFIDAGESVEEALCREVLEELNLVITESSYLTSFPNEYLFSGLVVSTTDLAFVCKVKSLDDIRVADDVANYQFVSVNEIDFSQISSRSIANILKFYQSHNGNAE